MHALKRWSIGIFSKVDEVVAKVENHEALVAAAIRELKSEMVEAKVQLNRVRKDGIRMAQGAEQAKTNGALWQKRAASTVDDNTTAIECLRRSKREQRNYKSLVERLEAHHQVETKLSVSISELDQKLDALKDKLNVLRTRQTSANALKLAGSGVEDFGGDVEEILSRWESKIESSEYRYETAAITEDALETEFVKREEEQALLKELEELRRE